MEQLEQLIKGKGINRFLEEMTKNLNSDFDCLMASLRSLLFLTGNLKEQINNYVEVIKKYVK